MLRLGPLLAPALLGTRRVSARQGWEGEKSSLFEQPAAFPGIGMSWRTEVGGRDKYFDEPPQDLC